MAIFRELDTSMYDGVSILENATYTTTNIMNPRNIPIVESNGIGIIKFSDISLLAEDNDCSYMDALYAIADTNDYNPDNISVAIDEADIICDPELVDSFDNVVVRPISENSLAYQYCKTLLEAYIESGNKDYLLAIIDEAEIGSGGFTELMQKAAKERADLMHGAHQRAYDAGEHEAERHLAKQAAAATNMEKTLNKQNVDDIEAKMKEHHAKQAKEQAKLSYKIKSKGRQALSFAKKNKGKLAIGAGLAAAAGGALALKNYKDNQEMKQLALIQHQMANAPRSWMAKKIASLRGLYSRYMQKAKLAKAAGQASVFQKVAHRILSVIDALMKKMQNLSN